MTSSSAAQNIELWPIKRLVEYPRNPRKNDAAVDRMCGSIREFGFKIPCLVRSDGEVIDGQSHHRSKNELLGLVVDSSFPRTVVTGPDFLLHPYSGGRSRSLRRSPA